MGTARAVSRGVTTTQFNLGALKIHPAIGIARVGNAGGDSKTTCLLGPEIPGAGPVGKDAGVGSDVGAGGANSGFKVGARSIKRQG